MSSRMMLCAALVTVVLTAFCLSVACADSVTSQTSKGKAYLTVTADAEPAYGLQLTLTRGRFRQWDSPEGWSAVLVRDSQLLWTTTNAPILPGQALSGFMVKATGPGRNTNWATLDGDGEIIAWGRLNLK